MTSSSEYQVDLSGQLLIEDGWHDAGQGNAQFVLTGDGKVTQQGGTIYSFGGPAMTVNNYKGQVSLLGEETNSYLDISAGSPSNVLVAGVIEVSAVGPFVNSEPSASVSGLSNAVALNYNLPIELPDTSVTPSYVEHMMSMARTQLLSPRKPITFDSTTIRMARLFIYNDGVGVRFADSVASRTVGSYSIEAANGEVAPPQSSCESGEISMAGFWTLQDGGDGFFGLSKAGTLLSENTTAHDSGDAITMVDAMSSARDRWIFEQIGDGSVKLTNRATGDVLTQTSAGCAYAASNTGNVNQHWLLGGGN
jgi:hypothetical protein